MSVVNKMLQDLEARQSETDQINADYQPPQKKTIQAISFDIAHLSYRSHRFCIKK